MDPILVVLIVTVGLIPVLALDCAGADLIMTKNCLLRFVA